MGWDFLARDFIFESKKSNQAIKFIRAIKTYKIEAEE